MDNSNDDVMIIKVVRKTNTKREMIDKTTQTLISGTDSKIHVSLAASQNPIVQSEGCPISEKEPNANVLESPKTVPIISETNSKIHISLAASPNPIVQNEECHIRQKETKANVLESPKTETESNYIILKKNEEQASSDKERLVPKLISKITKMVSIDGKSESKVLSNAEHSENHPSSEDCSPFKKDVEIVDVSVALKRTRIVSPRNDKHNEVSSKEHSPPKKISKIIHESDLLKRLRTVSPRNNNTSDIQILTSDPGFIDKIDLKRTEMNNFAEKSESKDPLIVELSDSEPSSKECSPSRKYSKAVHEADLLKCVRTISPRNNNSSDLQILTSEPGFIDKIDLKRAEMNSFTEKSESKDLLIVELSDSEPSSKECSPSQKYSKVAHASDKIKSMSRSNQNPIVQNEELRICEKEPNANVLESPKTETESNYIILKKYEKQASSDKEKLVPRPSLIRTKTVCNNRKSENKDSSNAEHSDNQHSSEECSPYKEVVKIVHGSHALKRTRIVSPRSDKHPENEISSKQRSPPKKIYKVIHESDLLKRMKTVSPRNNNSSDLQILTSYSRFKNKIDLKRTEKNSFSYKPESKDPLIVELSDNEPPSKECSPSQKYSKIAHGSDLTKRERTVSSRSNNSSYLHISTSDPGFIDKIDLKKTEKNSFFGKPESKDSLIVELSDNEHSSKECSPSKKYSKISPGSDLMKRMRTGSSISNSSLDLPSLTSDRGFIDTHCHLDFLFERQNFKGTHAEYMELHKDTYPANYEGCVTVFCDPFSFQQKEIWQAYLKEEGVWAAFGCHPKNARYYDDNIESALCSALLHSKVRALGEIGLDYSARNQSPKSTQHIVLMRQIRIALDHNLPLVIHCRDATDDCMRILKEAVPREHTIHLHCFNEGWDIAHEWLRAFPNLFIGLTNLVTFPSARPVHEVAKHISLKRLLLETDAPYFLPKKGPRCSRFSHPGMAIHVATEVAAIREMSVAEVLYYTRQNAFKMYGI